MLASWDRIGEYDVANIYELIREMGMSKEEAKQYIDPDNEFESFEDAVDNIELADGHDEVISRFLEEIDGIWDYFAYPVRDHCGVVKDFRYIVVEYFAND